jgi:hypothetical protein
MGFVSPASLKLRDGFRYVRLLAEQKLSTGARCSIEKEHCTAAKEDLGADRDPLNIHTRFQQADAKGR